MLSTAATNTPFSIIGSKGLYVVLGTPTPPIPSKVGTVTIAFKYNIDPAFWKTATYNNGKGIGVQLANMFGFSFSNDTICFILNFTTECRFVKFNATDSVVIEFRFETNQLYLATSSGSTVFDVNLNGGDSIDWSQYRTAAAMTTDYTAAYGDKPPAVATVTQMSIVFTPPGVKPPPIVKKQPHKQWMWIMLILIAITVVAVLASLAYNNNF